MDDGILNFISDDALLNCARRLGLAQGKTLLLDDMDDYDLAIYTAPPDRSRAIDRYSAALHWCLVEIDVFRACVDPTEYDPPSISAADPVLARQIAFQDCKAGDNGLSSA